MVVAMAVARLVTKKRKRICSHRCRLNLGLLFKSRSEKGPVWKACQTSPASLFKNPPEVFARFSGRNRLWMDSGIVLIRSELLLVLPRQIYTSITTNAERHHSGDFLQSCWLTAPAQLRYREQKPILAGTALSPPHRTCLLCF